VTWVRNASTVWLALGDSYSAGVGVPGPIDSQTNRACRTHREQSYAGQAKQQATNAGRTIAFQFAACMNAKTVDILKPQSGTGQLAQLEYVKANRPDVVTITIGGNDIRFPTIARLCVANAIASILVSCPVDSNSMALDSPKRGERASWDGLYDRLVNTYVAIRQQQPATGHLYVNSYPVLFDNPSHWNRVSQILQRCGVFSATESRLANAMSVRLGDTTFKAVQEANRRVGGVHFVDWRPPVVSERISGRVQRVAYDPNGLCSRNPLPDATMNPLYLPGLTPAGHDWHDSFHPTTRGYARGATVLTNELNLHTW
jgi:hypothetical protein